MDERTTLVIFINEEINKIKNLETKIKISPNLENTIWILTNASKTWYGH